MFLKRRLFLITILSLGTLACLVNGDLIRPAYYSLAYSKGHAMLAANGQSIKINVLIGADKDGYATKVSEGLNKYGPKWLNARYAPISKNNDQGPYQMKWAFDVTENGNAAALCRKQSSDLRELVPSTGVVLAAFCLNNKTLTSARARVKSLPNSDEFLKTIGAIGRELLVIHNPVREDNCWVIGDCT